MVGQSNSNATDLDLLKACCRFLEDQKAKDAILIQISERSSFADYFIVAGASSLGHLKGLLAGLDDFLIERGIHGRGTRRGIMDDETWVLIDCGDFIVHLMLEDARNFYDLEKLWFESPKIDFRG